MTRRRTRRRRGSLHLRPAAMTAAAVILFAIAAIAWHTGGLLLITLIAAIAFYGGRRSTPALKGRTRTPAARGRQPRQATAWPHSAPDLRSVINPPGADQDRRIRADVDSTARQLAAWIELDQARADITALRAELADAKASAEAAWDAAADRPPARRRDDDTMPLRPTDADHLADTPMSGARRIGPP
jgi:hypothetical protein